VRSLGRKTSKARTAKSTGVSRVQLLFDDCRTRFSRLRIETVPEQQSIACDGRPLRPLNKLRGSVKLRSSECKRLSPTRRLERSAGFSHLSFSFHFTATKLAAIFSVAVLLRGMVLDTPAALAQSAPPQKIALETPAGSSVVVDRINYYRRLMNLPEVSEDEAMSERDRSEAHSSLENYSTPASVSALLDSGTKALPAVGVLTKNAYGLDGAGAPETEVSISPVSTSLDGNFLVDRLMAMPFTALRVIDPQLTQVGFGAECTPSLCVVVISVKRGLTKDLRLQIYEGSESDRFWNARLGPIPPTRGRLKTPVFFPPDGVITPVRAYRGGDWPNPLQACGYSSPSGPPLILQLGSGSSQSSDPDISEHELTLDGRSIEHCLIQPSSFPSSNPSEGTAGERDLSAFGAAIIISREPLSPSGNYEVSITADSTKYSWSFRTGPAP